MKKLMLSLVAACAAAVSFTASAKVYRPGLLQAKFGNNKLVTSSAKYPKPLTGLLNRTDCSIDYAYGSFMANFSADNTKKYVNPYSGKEWNWDSEYSAFCYEGEIYLHAGEELVMVGRFDDGSSAMVDGTILFDQEWAGDSGYNRGIDMNKLVTVKAAVDGWHPIACNVYDWSGGKVIKDWVSGVQYNLNGCKTDPNKTEKWAKLTDSGDGSFLRFATDESFMTLGTVNVDGDDALVDASFANVPVAAKLRVYYGSVDGGECPEAWANSADLADIPAGDTAVATYRLVGLKDVANIRLCLIKTADEPDTSKANEAFYEFSSRIALDQTAPTLEVLSVVPGYTNAELTVSLTGFGLGATKADIVAELSDSDTFEPVLKTVTVGTEIDTLGQYKAVFEEINTNAAYFVRAVATNEKGISGASNALAFKTLLPTDPAGEFLIKSNASTSQTFLAMVTDLGDDSHSAVITMQCATDEDFTEGLCESDPLDIGETDLNVEKELSVLGLQKDTPYYSRLKIVNAWGLTYYAETFFCPTFDSLVVQGIGYTAVEDGFNVDVVVSYMDGDSATVELFANGVSVGTQELTAAGTASFAVSSAANLTALRAVVTGEITVEKSASAKKGTTQVVIGDPAEHATVATAVKLHAGDGISLPSLMGKASYKVLNQSFLSLDDIVLTAIKPGIVGVEVYGVDGALATTMAVIVLPEKIGSGNIYIRAESGNQDWHSAANWTTVDGAVATDCPHNADDIAIIPRLGNAQYFKVKEDISLGGLYVGVIKSGVSATYHIQRADNMKTIPVVTFERTDGEPVTIQVCGNNQKDAENLRTYLQFGDSNNKLGFNYKNDTILDGGWDGIAAKLANGRPNYASNCTNEIPAGVTLTWRNIDNTGTSMGCTFDAPVLAGEGTVWNRSAANIKYSRSSGDFTGVIRDSSHGNANIDRSGPTFFSAAIVAKASAEAYGFVYNKSGSPDCNSSCVGMLCTGWDPSYGAPGFHGNYFPECGLTLVNGTFRCGSVENSGWGKGVAEVKYTEKFTIGRGFSYMHRNNNRNNKDGHPINWFETDALVHADRGTIRIDDYHRSNYADVSDTTNTVTILRGFKNFAVGGAGDPKTSENYPIVPWMVTPSKNTDNGKLAFTCADGDDRICDMGTRTNRKLDEVVDEDENAFVNNKTTALTADRTVNSLWIWNQNQEKKFGADRTLTVKSGGVIFRADDSSFGTKTGGDANGAVVLGDATKPGYIFAESTNASKPNSIYAKVTAPGGLVFGYTGYAVLAGDQTGVDDELVVNAGTLDLGSQDKTVACTLDVPVRILANATVKLNNVEMKDSAVYFDDIAGYSGKIQLNAAETTCLKLYRRDTPEETEWTSLPRGTYSAATHPDLFTGTGTLVVRKDDLARGMYLIVK